MAQSTVRIIVAKYPGTCACGCGATLQPGTTIQYAGRGLAYLPGCTVKPGDTPTCGPSRSTTRPRYGSTYTRFSSGAEVYRNRNGRCIDAPCCGCCS